MQASNCQNCNHLLSETYNFCPICSQTTHIHRFSIKHLLHEFFHAFTHTDRGILLLLKGLATNPGVVLKEYIIEGKRKKYFSPFTFLLIVLGISVIMNTIVHPFVSPPNPNPAVLAQIKSPTGKQKYIKSMEKIYNLNSFIEKRSNIVTMLAIPLITLVFWLMFKRKNITYAEHFVAYVLMIGFAILVATFTITPLMSLFKGTTYYFVLVIANLVLQMVYFSWGYKTFLNLKKTSQVLRVALANFLGILFWTVLSMLVAVAYILWF